MLEHLGKHPDKTKLFTSAMKSFNVSLGHEPLDVTKTYRRESFGKGTIVDVGGSEGHVSIALAERYPLLNFVVQDRPEVVKDGVEEVPHDLSDHIKFMALDFFTEQPIKAEAYLLRRILQNWPDLYCVKILQSLVPALKKVAGVIINDGLMPEPNTLPHLAEKRIR